MSRAERRAYQRMTKNQDPFALPVAQRVRLDQQRARRARARPRPAEFRFASRRFLTWLLVGAVGMGLLALSVAWPNGMPVAAYAGIGGALAWAIGAVAVRLVQGRGAAGGSR